MNIGIDLGTSYSSVAAEVNGKIEMIRVSTGASAFGDSFSMPTAVYIDNGDTLLGQAALNKRKISPSCFKNEFKRDFGTTTPYILGGEEYLPEQLYTELFIYFKNQSEKQIGKKVEKAYITHPANYGNNKKRLLEKAANNAGLFDIVLVDEPTAAAAGYAQKNKIVDGDILLVYDLGGGTFDAALIKKTSRGYVHLTEPLGISQCGGVDFDRVLFDDIIQKMSKDGDFDMDRILKEKRFTASLSEICVQIKHQLSQAKAHTEPIAVGFDYFDYKITRQEFEGLIRPFVSNTCEKVRDLIKNSGLSGSDIDKVLLVGGSSRIPLVQDMVCEALKKEASFDADPELAVCQGAVGLGIMKTEAFPRDDRERKIEEKESRDFEYNDLKQNEKAQGLQQNRQIDQIKDEKNDKDKQYEQKNQKLNDLLKRADERWQRQDKYEHSQKVEDRQKQYRKESAADILFPESKAALKPELMKELMSGVISGFNTWDGEWIYYTENDYANYDYGLYKIYIDGTRKTRLIKSSLSLGVHSKYEGGWVYYQVKANDKDRGNFYRIRKDGTGETRISNELTYHYNLRYVLKDGWIYFSNNDIHLKKMRSDGSCITNLVSDMCPLNINVERDWIYYKSYDNRLSRICIDGTKRTNICKTNYNIDQIHAFGDWVFYVTKTTEEKLNKKTDTYDLWKVRFDGTGNYKVSSDFCRGNIRIIGSLIYYHDLNNVLCRMHLDGTGVQRVSPEMLKQVLAAIK